MQAIEQFRDVIRAAGLQPPDVIEPGKFHKFPGEGKRNGNTAAWCKLFADGIGGIFGDYSTGLSTGWQANREPPYTQAERETFMRHVAEAKAQAEKEQAERQAKAATQAAAIWDDADDAPEDHPYLIRKGIKAHGMGVYHGDLVIGGMACEGALIAPMKIDGVLHSLQFTAPNGDKRFLPGGRTVGTYYALGTAADLEKHGVMLLAEGFSTAATLREATGYVVLVCFSAGNLAPVATFRRAKYPEARIFIAGDFDASGTGQSKATEAAKAVNGLVALPPFTPAELAAEKPPSDWNDYSKMRGPGAVKTAIAAAMKVCAGDTATDPPAADPDGWIEPEPLPDGLLPVEAFDYALLPDTLTPWARDICERVQCAPDYVAVAIMAGLGSIIGRKLGIRPQAFTDWTVTPNQWALVVGRPGVLKSPALEAALSPIKRLAAVATEAHKADMEQHRIALRVAKLAAEEGEKSARKLLGKVPGTDVSHLLGTEEPEAPALRRYIAVDSNAASLGELHRQNHNGLLVHRDELISLLRSLDREDQAEARGFYLVGWNGDSSYTFDRIGRGLNLHIPAVCLSMLGSTQPGRLAGYIAHAVKGGAGDDGLIQRFGLLVWPDMGGEWHNVDRWPDSTAKKEAHRVFEYLDKLNPATVGALQDTDHENKPEGIPYLRFDDAALGLFLEWRTDLEARLRGGDLHPALESHLAKYRKLVPALALTLHLASDGTGPVSERATLQALAWAEYLETHARRAYGSVSMPEVATAKAILSRIRKGDLKREFSSRDVWRPGWAMLSDSDQVADALRLLVEYDWLTTTRTDTGGRPATIYTVNSRGFA
jgi:putative DNA primase/helicase